MTQRTQQQNKALHLYCRMLSEALTEAGLDMKAVLKPDIEIPWNELMVKECIWKPVQKIMLDQDSTADSDTCDYNKIYEVVHRHMAEKHGITVLWPDHRDIAT